MRSVFSFVLLSVFLSQTACNGGDNSKADQNFKADQNRIAVAIEKIGQTKDKVFLYSLDPNDRRFFDGKPSENSATIFYRYPILGLVEIALPEEKAQLFGALAKGARESEGMVAACFNPRHGIRVVSKTATNDFVICFECMQVQAYGFAAGQGFLTSGSPGTTFNNFLSKYHIKQARRD